jgi:hypothetical protein
VGVTLHLNESPVHRSNRREMRSSLVAYQFLYGVGRFSKSDGITEYKAIELTRLAGTFLASDGDIDKLTRRVRVVFGSLPVDGTIDCLLERFLRLHFECVDVLQALPDLGAS